MPTFDEKPDDMIGSQRLLRRQLLDCPSAIKRKQARELAAEMLLYLDDSKACWQICVAWLLVSMHGERSDGGFLSCHDGLYQPMVESLCCDNVPLPSILQSKIPLTEPGITVTLSSPHSVVYSDMTNDPRISFQLRRQMISLGTLRKLATVVRNRANHIGLLCVDRAVRSPDWTSEECQIFEDVIKDVVEPILGAAYDLDNGRHVDGDVHNGTEPNAPRLTAAEIEVARLVCAGYSYKEIARALGRPLFTVDHQLRRIREKFKVKSTSKLIRELVVLQL